MAKRFEFRLDVVRDMRQRVRDQAAHRVAVRISEAAAAQRRVDAVDQAFDELGQESRDGRQSGIVSVSELRSIQYFGTWLHKQSQSAREKLNRAGNDLVIERAELTGATARLKAIEKLRERRYHQHMVLMRREEQAANDEIAGRVIEAAKNRQESC